MSYRSQKRQLTHKNDDQHLVFGHSQTFRLSSAMSYSPLSFPGCQHVNRVSSNCQPHLQQLSLKDAKASMKLILSAGTWEKLATEVLEVVLLTN